MLLDVFHFLLHLAGWFVFGFVTGYLIHCIIDKMVQHQYRRRYNRYLRYTYNFDLKYGSRR